MPTPGLYMSSETSNSLTLPLYQKFPLDNNPSLESLSTGNFKRLKTISDATLDSVIPNYIPDDPTKQSFTLDEVNKIIREKATIDFNHVFSEICRSALSGAEITHDCYF